MKRADARISGEGNVPANRHHEHPPQPGASAGPVNRIHAMRPLLRLAFATAIMLSAFGFAAEPQAVGQAPEAAAAGAVRFDPVVRDLEGWEVCVEPALLDGAHREEGARALAMLANHLQRIKILVPPPQLADLQKVGIWIEHDHPRLKSMQYHPSRGWLVANRHDPRLERMVHITQARELLSRAQMLKHPAVILHELAHAYHDRFLGFDHPEIIAVFEQAKAAGGYEQVLLYTGEQVKHYGLTNHKEYFAEGTEAFFYRNDFFPFVRAELKRHDPALHDLLVKIWEEPKETKEGEKKGK
jgi:hypothetical protein